jgi:hypothetical protein
MTCRIVIPHACLSCHTKALIVPQLLIRLVRGGITHCITTIIITQSENETKGPRDEQIEYRTGAHNHTVVVAAAVHGFVGNLIISMWWRWWWWKNRLTFPHLINRIVV